MSTIAATIPQASPTAAFWELVTRTLGDLESRVIELRYHLGMTQDQCAERLHVSRQRISTVELKALRRLRDRAGGHLAELLPVEAESRESDALGEARDSEAAVTARAVAMARRLSFASKARPGSHSRTMVDYYEELGDGRDHYDLLMWQADRRAGRKGARGW